MRRAILAAMLVMISSALANAADLTLYGAGSLRESIGQIAREFGQAHGLAIATQFGHAGRMRERIEAGEHADLFTSADVGSPRKLVADGRASVMAVFARNTVCLLSPARFGATTETALDRLLAPGTRIGVPPPKADPLGDYTVRLFGLADRVKPGIGATLQSRAVVLQAPDAGSKTGDEDADAILDGRVDAAIVYCSAKGRFAKLLPDAEVVEFPARLRIGPEYGLAVLKGARPEAAMLALYILSPAGQTIMAEHGFRPVTLPAD